ncbi:hypothetical protein AB1K84_25150 [Mesobacillus foraminis]|uniref:hypothetical protein n=1 Tax=Mesobacillus foraminis TaxID=279826 RepID=UPI00399F860E
MNRKLCCLLFTFLLLNTSTLAFAETNHPLESQIISFMTGLQVDNSKDALNLWLLGVKNRSGAVQYALLSPTLQKQTRRQYEQRGWVTGGSSPWIDNIEIVKVNKINNSSREYTITYELLNSAEKLGTGRKVITVSKNPLHYRKNWFITKILTTYNQYELFTPAETVTR